MVEWRERGFVQDSDEDGDISDNDVESEGLEGGPAGSHADIAADGKQLDNSGSRLSELENADSPTPIIKDLTALPSSPGIKQDFLTPKIECAITQANNDEFEDIDELQLDTENSNGHNTLGSDEIDTATGLPETSNDLTLIGDLYDVPSSPLSEVPSNASSDGRNTPPTHTPALGLDSELQLGNLRNLDRDSGKPAAVQDLSTKHGQTAVRTFRRRNPIQIHPYLLESEKYRQTFRDRGLRPVAFADAERDRARETQESETAYQSKKDADESQSTRCEESLQSQPSAPQLSAARQESDHSDYGSDGEELPSVADLLRTPANHNASRGEKRRKLIHIHSRDSERLREPTDAPQLHTSTPASNQNEIGFNLFDLLPSPKTSGDRPISVVPKRRAKKFRMPKGCNKNQLPTPVASSDTAKAQATNLQVDPESDLLSNSDVESDNEFTHQSAPCPNIHSSPNMRLVRSPSPKSNQSSPSESDEMQKASKRIKGVLPASWLRLDQQGQKHRPTRPHHIPLPKITSSEIGPQRGVAQRITAGLKKDDRKLHDDLLGRLEISDGSESTDNNESSVKETERRNKKSKETIALWNFDTQDIDEADFVDPMLPAAPRNRISKPKRGRQLRLFDAYNRAKEIFGPGQHSESSARLSPRNPQREINTTEKPAPRFSIVDAVRSMPRRSTPDFLRLAVRQAKLRPDKARHSPSGKVISLHVRADNIEQRRNMKHWKRGHITPWKEYVDSSYRYLPRTSRASAIPLAERSNNQQGRLPSPEKISSGVSKIPSRQSSSSHNSPSFDVTKSDTMQGKINATSMPRTTEKTSISNQSEYFETEEKCNTPPLPNKPKTAWARPGQLENLQMIDDEEHPESAFQRQLLHLDDRLGRRRSYKQRISNPLLERYVGNGRGADTPADGAGDMELPNSIAKLVRPATNPTRRERKRRPKPLPINSQTFERLTSEDFFPNELEISVVDDQPNPQHSQLFGLGSFGTKYTNDFGIKPLPLGTFFHQSTFIGSGELHRALEIHKHDFDVNTTYTQFTFNGQDARLGPWIEETSSRLEKAFKDVSESIKLSYAKWDDELERASRFSEAMLSVTSVLRSTIAYYGKSLSFLDSIDRRLFVARTCENVAILFDTVSAARNSPSLSTKNNHLLMRSLSLLAVCSFENMKIANHPVIDSKQKQATEQIFRRISMILTKLLIDCSLPRIEDSLRQLQQKKIKEAGIQDDQVEIEALVVLVHLLRSADKAGFSLCDVLNDALLQKPLSTVENVQDFELPWSCIFTVLPILEFDTFGTAKPGLGFECSIENWSLVKILLQRLFYLYSKSSYGDAATMNSYLRATLARCFTLVNDWGWRKCEPALGQVFDFFAKRNFALLYNEDNKSQPGFLERLDQTQAPVVEPSDRSFDIFLKFLATGLLHMKSVYMPKKIKNIAWRFIPNHGRSHIKEDDLHEDDLDALRNHHNLLLVLYWASPTSHRINVDLIRNLVDFQSSHSEVCRLNVRAWANLVRFQLSVDEDVSAIDPFANWFNSILSKSLRQHEKARPEAENMMGKMKRERNIMSKEMLETTISSNEREIERILALALACMGSVLANAKVISAAMRLFEKSTIADVFHAFKPKHRRFGDIVTMALDVYQSYFNLLETKRSKRNDHEASEDSQDYGEWSLLDNIEADLDSVPNIRPEYGVIAESIQHLQSNIFGAENLFNESLLMKVVDTWVRICHFRVKQSKGDWSYYLDNQSPGSWFQLRDTEQTRKFAPYFFSAIVQCDENAFADNAALFLSTWLTSLVERESMLKYQHLLTTALLNAGSDHPLLQNLPFARAKESQLWNVSLADLRARRLLLLSSILLNMRESFENSLLSCQIVTPRQELANVLRQLMQAMKKNYLETQPSSSTRGAYVEFAHRIVEFLQQYTADICPVDKFFTDSSAFPLPATDPTYVVGRLKNYSLQLGNSSVQKKLATFFQVSCERAVVDNEQSYLISQLVNSVAGSFESSTQPQPSLRCFLLDALFPSYIESALSTDCGWILVTPILEACSAISDDLLYCFSASEKATCGILVNAVTSVFSSLRKAIAPAVTRPALFLEPHVLIILTGIVNCFTSALTAVDYIHRTWKTATIAIRHATYFHALSTSLSDVFEGQLPSNAIASIAAHMAHLPSIADNTHPPSSFGDIASFSRRELHETLTKSWVKHDGRYYVLRGNSRKEVMVRTKSFEEGKSALLQSIAEFRESVERLPAFRTVVSTNRRGLTRSVPSRGE